MAHHKDPPVTMHYMDAKETQTPLAKQTLSKKVLENDTTVRSCTLVTKIPCMNDIQIILKGRVMYLRVEIIGRLTLED